LLQTVDGIVQHDFVFELQHAIEYQNWLETDRMSATYCSLEDLETLSVEHYKDYIPVGTIEFVYKFIDLFIQSNGSAGVLPQNIPFPLSEYDYTQRVIGNFELTDALSRKGLYDYFNDYGCFDVFIKSNSKIKSLINGIYKLIDILDYNKIPNGCYQISETIDIASEYRCFVYKNELCGIQYYSGDFKKFPDVSRIECMIGDYETYAPIAYTLDVALTTDNKTVIIEVHDFFSCGLYGFSDYQHLPYMFKRTFDNIKNRLTNE
ncbi:MAG: ATP-grasp domain-containing protein, partial [Bacilli bacterium]|nr:ATP-grasp domain-containing protein [Bacilli bacterium]